MSVERVNVSSVQDFMQCRFRWWCTWVMNRVSVATGSALDAGRLLHRAFERHERNSVEGLGAALALECREFRAQIPLAHPAARSNAEKAVQVMEDLVEAMPLWRDKFPVDEVLEVEEAFEWPDPKIEGLIWVGRPDRVVRSGNRSWHGQRRGLAAGMNFGTYIRLQKRSYHEHLYAEGITAKYGLKHGGTVFDLVRKLKFRTYVGKRNEATKTADEMFFQQAVGYSISSPLHRAVMQAMRGHVLEMLEVKRRWHEEGIIPSPNEKMNGGFSGNIEDPYFRILIGETTLDDDTVFKPREETYAHARDTTE